MTTQKIDTSKVTYTEMDDLFPSEYPEFSSAYFVYAEYDGKEMTEEQLELLNEDFEFRHQEAFSKI